MPLNTLLALKRLSNLLIASVLVTGCASLKSPNREPIQRLQPPAERILLHRSAPPIEQNPVYQLLIAEMAVNIGDTQLAIDNFLALALSQDDPKIAERAVRIAVYGQDFAAAQIAAERWIELEPDRSEASQVISAIYIRQDNADLAYHYIDRVINAQPDISDQTFVTILGLLAREQSSETLLTVSKRIADNYSGYAYANFLHGHLSSNADRAEETLEYLDKALAIKEIPDAHALRAKALIKLDRNEEAVISLQRAVLTQPNNKPLRLSYARLLVDIKEYERARMEFEKLHLLAPEDTDLLYTLGLLSLESRRFDAAEDYFTKLLNSGKRKGESQYYLGRIFQSKGQYPQAIDWYKKVNNGEYRFDAQIRSAQLMALLGDTDGALDYLKKISEASHTEPSLVRIYLTQGEILNQAKRHKDAIKAFSKGLEIIPGSTDLLYARGLTGERIGNVELLEGDMRTILKTEPDNAHALNALGYTLADLTDRIEEAYQYIKRAIEISPEEPAFIDSYGWINYRMGNYEEAIRQLRKALSIMEDGEIAAHLGEVLWVSGQQQQALDVWNRTLSTSPDNPYILETMQRLSAQ